MWLENGKECLPGPAVGGWVTGGRATRTEETVVHNHQTELTPTGEHGNMSHSNALNSSVTFGIL